MMKKFCSLVISMLAATLFAAETPGAYKVMILGDAHYDAPEFYLNARRQKKRERNIKMWQGKSQKLFAAAGKRAETDHVAFAVQLGDLAQGDCITVELQQKMLRDAFAAVKHFFPHTPLLVVKGNHDVRTAKKQVDNATTDAALLPLVAAELKVPELKNGNYAFRQGPDLFIAVDGFIPAKECVDFVRKSLEDNPDARYVFFMSHMPIICSSPLWALWLQPGHLQIAEMLESRPSVILSAHTHLPSLASRTSSRGRIVQLVVASLGSDWENRISPGKFKDWKSYLDTVKKRTAKNKRADEIFKSLEEIESKGEYTFEQLFINSGFVVLDINDRQVTANFYTRDADEPTVSIVLTKNPAAKQDPEAAK